MNTNYRYRVYDKKTRKMSYVLDKLIYFADDTLCVYDGGFDEDNFVIMQWTRVYDKHDVEIFEADILRNRYGQTGVVIYNEGMCAYCWEYGENWGHIDVNYDEIEVIGNIWENVIKK